MRKTMKQPRPHAQTEGLVVQEMPDELLIYDRKRHKAHCLNETAALVWKHCDGQTTAAEIAGKMEQKLGAPVDEGVVWFALSQLEKANLLQERVTRKAGVELSSRRELLKRLGTAAVLAAPVIMSIPSPTAAAAATQPCVPEEQCQPSTECFPCHTTGSTDCAKRCRPKPGGGGNSFGFQCVGIPAAGCPGD